MELLEVYNRLKKTYGHQGWWPIFIDKKDNDAKLRLYWENNLAYGIAYKNLKDYHTKTRDPYFEIAAGAILTQSAAWKNVALATVNLYRAKVLTPRAIYKLKLSALEKLIRPAGYFRQKAKKLKIFSKWLLDEFDGDILELGDLDNKIIREKLLELWGIGRETADSIMLYALNKPTFVIDEYTKRLCKIFKMQFKDYDHYKKYFEKNLGSKKEIFKEFHALIVRSGKEKHKTLISDGKKDKLGLT